MVIMFFLFYSYSLCFYYFVPNIKFRQLCDIIMRICLKQAWTWRMINDKKGNKLLLAVISQGLKIKTEQYQILDFGIRIKK